MPNWDQDNQGIIINVVLGHETALAAGAGCLLRIEFAARLDQPESPPHAIQLGMTAKQARELAEDLCALADRAVQVPPGTKPS
jgi:hypothetical protein